MPRKDQVHAGDVTRPHRAVISNLLAVQARLRGDAVPVHPSARQLPALPTPLAPALAHGFVEVPDEDAPVADVIALPGAAATAVRNPGAPDADVRDAFARLGELEARLEALQDDLLALVDRLEPDAGPARPRVSPEDAIVRLQRLIDRRLGSA